MCSLSAGAQTIKKLISYSKNTTDTRIVALLSDNTMHWYDGKKEWQAIPKTGLPSGIEIQDLEVYQKPGMMTMDTRFVLLSTDNSIYWYAEKKGWEKIDSKGMPEGKKIRDITVHLKGDGLGYGGSMRLIAQLDDNTVWWVAPNSEWKKLETAGLPLGK